MPVDIICKPLYNITVTLEGGESVQSTTINEFQARISGLPVRNKSILDILTKMQTTSGMINRSVVKSVTGCGCISICAEKQAADYFKSDCLSTHIKGSLCPACRDAVRKAMGENLFYFALLCSTFNMSLEDIINNEHEFINTLGRFSLR